MSIHDENGRIKPQFVLTAGRAAASDNPKAQKVLPILTVGPSAVSDNPKALKRGKRTFANLNDKEKFKRVSMSLSSIGKMLGRQRHILYGAIQNAAIHGDWLRNSPASWKAFCHLSGWADVAGRPREADIANATRFVLRWRCGLDDDGNKAASFYHRAVGPYLSNGGAPHDLRRYIKEHGGLNKLTKLGHDELPTPYPEDGSEPAETPAPPTVSEQVGEDKGGGTPSVPQGKGDGSQPPLGFDLSVSTNDETNLRESKNLPRVVQMHVSLSATSKKGRIKGTLLGFTDDNPWVEPQG